MKIMYKRQGKPLFPPPDEIIHLVCAIDYPRNAWVANVIAWSMGML